MPTRQSREGTRSTSSFLSYKIGPVRTARAFIDAPAPRTGSFGTTLCPRHEPASAVPDPLFGRTEIARVNVLEADGADCGLVRAGAPFGLLSALSKHGKMQV